MDQHLLYDISRDVHSFTTSLDLKNHRYRLVFTVKTPGGSPGFVFFMRWMGWSGWSNARVHWTWRKKPGKWWRLRCETGGCQALSCWLNTNIHHWSLNPTLIQDFRKSIVKSFITSSLLDLTPWFIVKSVWLLVLALLTLLVAQLAFSASLLPQKDMDEQYEKIMLNIKKRPVILCRRSAITVLLGWCWVGWDFSTSASVLSERIHMEVSKKTWGPRKSSKMGYFYWETAKTKGVWDLGCPCFRNPPCGFLNDNEDTI